MKKLIDRLRRWSHDLDLNQLLRVDCQQAADELERLTGALADRDLLPVLEALLAEFDRYDEAMAEHGRGHEDYGGQRTAARAAILAERRRRPTPPAAEASHGA